MSTYTVWFKWYESFSFPPSFDNIDALSPEDAATRCLIRVAKDMPADSAGVLFRVMCEDGTLRFFNYTHTVGGAITEMLPEEHSYGEAS